MPKNRTLKWFTRLQTLVALADNAQLTFNLLNDMSVADMEGSTVTRMLMEIWIRNDVAGNQKTMDWGILWVDEDAVAAGAVPDADDEDERADWIGRGRMSAVTDVLLKPDALFHAAYDLRSQRICRTEQDQLTLILDMDSNGAGGVFVSFIVRTLMRMP